MLPKTFTLRAPLDNQAWPLEDLLNKMAAGYVQMSTGTYTGSGRTGKVVKLPFTPSLLIITPAIQVAREITFPIDKHPAIYMTMLPGLTYFPGTGYTNDEILSVSVKQFTLGITSDPALSKTNADGQEYTYFILG